MTDDQLLELNTWIAEKVMGWRLERIEGSPYSTEVWKGDGVVSMLANEWVPTTEMNDAEHVLKKCALECVHGFLFEPVFNGREIAKWNVSDAPGNIFAEAETIPLAICLFAKE